MGRRQFSSDVVAGRGEAVTTVTQNLRKVSERAFLRGEARTEQPVEILGRDNSRNMAHERRLGNSRVRRRKPVRRRSVANPRKSACRRALRPGEFRPRLRVARLEVARGTDICNYDVELSVGERHRLRRAGNQRDSRPIGEAAAGQREIGFRQVEPGDREAREVALDLAQEAAGAAADIEQPRRGRRRPDARRNAARSGTSACRRISEAPPPNSTST